MCDHWTEAKLFKFLRLYKRYECLWNPYFPEYKCCDAKSEAFSQILYEMNVFGLTVNQCLNQIKYIRETYKQEQQRLENLAFLGGRRYSNLLWYPLMNRMLSKVIQDEEKLNHETSNLDLVVASKYLPPSNSGDQQIQRELCTIEYGRRTFPWNHGETATTISPYFANSNYGDYMNYFHPNILNNCNGMCAPNEHISSCPTCGYLSGSACNCFSMNNVEYHPDNTSESYSSESQINYRPRTSYNYRNGILEINSAVRIPLSPPTPNCIYNHLIESITPEEPEYNFEPILSNQQSEVETIEEEDGFLIEYSAKSLKSSDKKDKLNDEYDYRKTLDSAVNNNSNRSNFSMNKNASKIKNINSRSKKAKKVKITVDEILRSQNVLGLFDKAPNSICKTIRQKNSDVDNNKPVRNDQENLNNDVQSPIVENKKIFDSEQKIAMPDSQQRSNVNKITENKVSKNDEHMTEVNVKVEQDSDVASENKHQMKENILSGLSQGDLRLGTKDFVLSAKCSVSPNLQVDFKLNSPRTREIETRDVPKRRCSQDVTSDGSEKIFGLETTEDLVRGSTSIIKHNLTKVVIDFIDDTLNKPDQRKIVDAEERLILKKVANDLRALENESNCDCDDKSMIKDCRESKQNGSTNCSRNKTICWREPIEESFLIVPCKSTGCPADETNYTKNIVAERPIQLNKRTMHCFRMMAGADCDVDDDMTQCNLLSQKNTRLKTKHTSMDECSLSINQKTRRENDVPANSNFEEHFIEKKDKKHRRSYGNKGRNVIDVLNIKSSPLNIEGCTLADMRFVESDDDAELNCSNSEVARHENPKLLCPIDIENEQYSVIVDELSKAKQSIEFDSQIVETNGQIVSTQHNLNTKICENSMENLKCCIPSSSTVQNIMEIENGVSMNVSVRISELTENERIDTVINQVTDILRKTLDKNGYTIGKKEFFTKKNLITNDNGEINGKRIGNEAVWKTELRSIISNLIKHKKSGDSLKFKVKTMILPAPSDSNIAAQGVTNLTLLSKTMKLFDRTKSTASDEHSEDLDSEILLHTSNERSKLQTKFLKNTITKSSKRNRRLIPTCKFKNITYSYQKSIKNVNRTVEPCNDHRCALWKLLKYLVKVRNQSIPKKYKKSPRNEPKEDKYEIINDKPFEQNHQKNDFRVASYSDKLPRNLNEDIDVYLCTEISQEKHSLMPESTDCDSYSNNSISHAVNRSSLSPDGTIQENSQMKRPTKVFLQETTSESEQDFGEWESFSESDEEAEIVKQCGYSNTFSPRTSKIQSKKNISHRRFELTENLNRRNRFSSNGCLRDDIPPKQSYSAVYALSESRRNTFWYRKRTGELEMLDRIILPSNKKYLMPSQGNVSKIIPSLKYNYNMSNKSSSNNRNNREELSSSQQDSKASSYNCTEFKESRGTSEYQMPNRSESEEDQLLSEAKLTITDGNQIKSCCSGDKTSSICSPIYDVNSRLRLFAIMKSQNETNTANHVGSSNNIRCCDKMDKLTNTDPLTYLKPCMKYSRKNSMIGDASERLTSVSCQTEASEREPQSHKTSEDCRENLASNLQVYPDETYSKNSGVIESKIKRNIEEIKFPDKVDRTKSVRIKRTTVDSNTQNTVSTSLDIPDLGGRSLTLEIKMLQPLFSIEVKKGSEVPKKTVFSNQQNESKLLIQDGARTDLSLSQESVIRTSTKVDVISSQQEDINCSNEFDSSTDSVNCGVRRIKDQGAELLPQNHEEKTLSCGIQTNQICKMVNDSSQGVEVCSEDSPSANSVAVGIPKKNALISSEKKLDDLESGGYDILFDTLRSMKNYENSCKTESNEFLANSSVSSEEKAIPQPEENLTNEIKPITLKTLINTVETSLRHITDPVIRKNLVHVIKCIRDPDQSQNYSAKEIHPQDQASEILERILSRNDIEKQVECKDNINRRSVLSNTKSSECQRPCESHRILNINNSRNFERIVDDVKILADSNKVTQCKETTGHSRMKMESLPACALPKEDVDNQISVNDNQAILPGLERSYCQKEPWEMLTAQRISLPGGACASGTGARRKTKSPNNTSHDNQVRSDDDRSDLQGNSCLMSTINKSPNRIPCEVEKVVNNSSSLNSSLTPPLQNDENYESSKYYCRRRESPEVDIIAFVSTIASQLRGLPTEAALRSQQRIQTLISNSRLESAKNKKYQ